MTLLEMMIALLIFSLLFFCITKLYRFSYENWTDGMMIEQLQRQTQTTMSFLESDVEQGVVTTTVANGLTTAVAPMVAITSDNIATTGNGYGVIINIATGSQWQLGQVSYRLTTLQNGALQRSIGTLNDSSQWTTLLDGVSCDIPPFTVSNFDLTTYMHQSLTIATLTVQGQNAVRTTNLSGAIVELSTTFTARGNSQLQYAHYPHP